MTIAPYFRNSSIRYFQFYDCRAPTSCFRWRIVILQNKRSPLQYLARDFALHADAFAVNDAHITKAARVGLRQVFFDDGLGLVWRDGMQIENIGDFQFDRIGKRVFSIHQIVFDHRMIFRLTLPKAKEFHAAILSVTLRVRNFGTVLRSIL